jgi:hypothetical protein
MGDYLMAVATWIKNTNDIEITVAAAATWVCRDYFPKGIVIYSISIKGITNDAVCFRNDGTSTSLNALLAKFGDTDGNGRTKYFYAGRDHDKIYRFPVLCISESNLAGSTFSVMIEYEE